jgi:hypothetical protein
MDRNKYSVTAQETKTRLFIEVCVKRKCLMFVLVFVRSLFNLAVLLQTQKLNGTDTVISRIWKYLGMAYFDIYLG